MAFKDLESIELKTADVQGIKRLAESVQDYFTDPKLWEFIAIATLKSILIIIVSWVVVTVGKKIIANVFALRMKTPLRYSERRQKTILKLLQNVLSYLVYFSAIVGILSAVNLSLIHI